MGQFFALSVIESNNKIGGKSKMAPGLEPDKEGVRVPEVDCAETVEGSGFRAKSVWRSYRPKALRGARRRFHGEVHRLSPWQRYRCSMNEWTDQIDVQKRKIPNISMDVLGRLSRVPWERETPRDISIGRHCTIPPVNC